MKKILMSLFVIMAIAAKSQCSSATTLAIDGTWLGNSTFTATDQWHKFTTAQDNYRISVYIENYNSSKHSVTIYSGGCSSPTGVTTTSYTGGDSLVFYTSGLTVSSDYYIKLGNGLSPTTETYNISVLSTNLASLTLAGCSGTATCYPNSCGELVCNGGFECVSQTVMGEGQIAFADNWASGNAGTPDLFTSPSGVNTFSIPCNAMGSEAAVNTGSIANKAYAGIIDHANQYTTSTSQVIPPYFEYIETKLISPMQSGKNYIISFDVSRGDMAQQKCDGLAIWTSSVQMYDNSTSVCTLTPKATISNTTLLNNYNGWQHISFCYSPGNSSEQFLMIGHPNGVTAGTYLSGFAACVNYPPPLYSNLSYLYIDNVSVRDVNNIMNTASYSVCANNPTVLTGYSCTPMDTYTLLWSPGTYLNTQILNNPTCTPTGSISYVVTLSTTTTDGSVCIGSSSIQVITYPSPGTLTVSATSTVACPGTSIVLTASAAAAGCTFSWTPGNLSGPSVTVSPNGTTVYSVTATFTNGCTTTGSIQLSYPFENNVFSGTYSPQVICSNLGQSTTLTATGAGTFSWNPGGVTGPTAAITPSASSVYTLYSTINGCTASQTLLVSVSNSCCTQTLTAFTATAFPTNTLGTLTYSTALAFNADVTIPSNMTVTLSDAEFIFAPSVRIIVSNGAQLTVDGSHLYACGTDMWNGIVVNDGGKVISMGETNSSLIEDAKTAIDVTNANSTVTPILDISQTTFNKNHIGIKIDTYQKQITSYPFSVKECVFTCRSFTFNSTQWPSTSTSDLRSATNVTTGLAVPYLLESASTTTLLSPYAGDIPYEGIYLNNVGVTTGTTYYGAVVGSSASVNDFNLFDNHAFGIDAWHTNLTQQNGVFQNTRLSCGGGLCYPVGGTGINHVNTNPLNFKLNLNAPSDNPSLGSRFWNNHYGISFLNTYKFDCNYATFRSTQTSTTTPGTVEVGNTGIFGSSGRFYYDISNNNFNNVNTGINILAYPDQYVNGTNTVTGVYANDITIENNFLGAQLNSTASISSNEYMNQAIIVCAPTNYSFNNVYTTGLYINENTIDRSYRGAYVFNFANYATDVVNNTIKLVDDPNSAPQHGIGYANVFKTSSIATNTLNSANTTNTYVTLFHGAMSASMSVLCNSLSSAYQGFEFNSNNPATIWKGNKMQPMPIGMKLMNAGVIGTQGGTTTPIDNQWQSTWSGSLYTTYAGQGSAAQNSPLWTQNSTSYIPANNNGTVSASFWYGATGTTYTTTGTYSCGGGGGAPPNVIVPNVSDLSADQGFIAENTVYRVLYFNSGLLSDTDLSDFYDGKSGSNMDFFMQVEAALSENDASTASSINSTITTSNDVDYYTQIFYSIYIDYLNDDFDGTDADNLLYIANLCPGLYGSEVYQARALYNKIFKISYNYTEDCEGSGTGGRLMNHQNQNNTATTSAKLQDEWQVDVYPNPATNRLTVTSNSTSEFLNIQIKDLSGRQILSKNLTTKNFMSNLDIDLPNGLYIISVKNSRNETVTKKLVISK